MVSASFNFAVPLMFMAIVAYGVLLSFAVMLSVPCLTGAHKSYRTPCTKAAHLRLLALWVILLAAPFVLAAWPR